MLRRTRVAARKGFTLVELLAVMVVLAVLAGVAVPKYFDYADRAKSSALEGSLGGVRAGLANFYTNQILDGDGRYPTLAELAAAGTVMQEPVPNNPYNGRSDIQAATDVQAAARTTFGDAGWNYYVDNTLDPPVAIFYANSDDETEVPDADGELRPASEL